MQALLAALAFVAGALLVVQVGANTQLSKGAGGSYAATTLQPGVSAMALTLLAAAVGTLGRWQADEGGHARPEKRH
jgi:uncharacterized membrane protein YdcZ (DUF606 family)